MGANVPQPHERGEVMGQISTRLMEYLSRLKAEQEPAPAEGRKLRREDQITEDARKLAGEERDAVIRFLFEELSARLYEGAMEPKLVCRMCSFEWEPGGLSDPLAVPLTPDGSLSAYADDLKRIGIS